MLNEYILGQLEEIDRKKRTLINKLESLLQEENRHNTKISDLLNIDDVGKEIFSPRESNEPLKLIILNLRKEISELELQEAEVRDQIEILTSEEEKYRKMLAEAGTRRGDPEKIENEIQTSGQEKRKKEELEILLKKLDTCIEYARTDMDRCRTELTNLKYYVKAILSE